jgi:hypothetical protein
MPASDKKPVELMQSVAESFRAFKFLELQHARQKDGFKQWMRELQGAVNKEKETAKKEGREPKPLAEGEGWSIGEGGTCFIKFDVTLPEEKKKKAEAECNAALGTLMKGIDWFKKVDGSSGQEAAANAAWVRLPNKDLAGNKAKPFSLGVKTLGSPGVNPAVDPVMLIQDKNGKMLTIAGRRNTDAGKPYAFPGGMVAGNVKNTCIDEMLEELYSADMFSESSQTASTANELPSDELKKKVEALFMGSKVDSETVKVHLNGAPKGEALKDLKNEFINKTEVQNIFNDEKMTTSQKIVALETYLNKPENRKKYGEEAGLSLKVGLYKTIPALQEKYKAFREGVLREMRTTDPLPNQSDPRNTDAASMASSRLVGVFTMDSLEQLQKEAALKITSTEELSDSGIVPVEVLENSFCDHSYYEALSVAEEIEQGRLEVTLAMIAQKMVVLDSYTEKLKGMQESLDKNPLAKKGAAGSVLKKMESNAKELRAAFKASVEPKVATMKKASSSDPLVGARVSMLNLTPNLSEISGHDALSFLNRLSHAQQQQEKGLGPELMTPEATPAVDSSISDRIEALNNSQTLRKFERATKEQKQAVVPPQSSSRSNNKPS